MRTLGIITAALGAVAGAGAVVLAVVSLPDIKRYLRMRQM